MTTSLHFQSLRKRFGRRTVLDDVELALEPATLTLLSGPNGTGKSTLLKILAGIERPDHGGLVCAGTTLRWQRARTRLRRRLIYLHQQPYLFDRSILGNLLYGLGGPRGCGRQHALAMLEELGLGYLAERPDSAGLSGGERQRLALARALLREPDFLLLDEPTASLDPQAREQCFGLIAALRKRGIGLVVASHDLVPLATLADHHWHLQDGRLRRGDPPAADRDGDAGHRVLPFPTVIAGGKS